MRGLGGQERFQLVEPDEQGACPWQKSCADRSTDDAAATAARTKNQRKSRGRRDTGMPKMTSAMYDDRDGDPGNSVFAPQMPSTRRSLKA